ncbi:pilus assembly protein TadE [Nocardioides gansuensis]|uniref:Pilus assembly protein TadE n=1 Tax=Nocardioides gansuensis TaxID=2138300 RepID=A0A2T8F8R0_9ACTN|nr:TadE family protein [Nocardioides gansuensis]PVG82118.1 pilus assembly protein TadE [Nocardioides gansuensis]
MASARDQQGATSVIQLVLVAPALLAMIMAIVQFGLVAHARNVAEQAAQEGAATARRFDGTTAAAEADALKYLTLLGSHTLKNRTAVAHRGPESASVTVTGDVLSLLPGIKLHVEEAAAGPVERYVAPSGESANSEGAGGGN